MQLQTCAILFLDSVELAVSFLAFIILVLAMGLVTFLTWARRDSRKKSTQPTKSFEAVKPTELAKPAEIVKPAEVVHVSNPHRSNLPPFKFRQITSLDDPAVDGVIKVYQEVFSEPPYCEHFSAEYVYDKVIVPHLGYYIMVAEDESTNQVVGFICGLPILSCLSLGVKDYLLSLPKEKIPFSLDQAAYGTDLGVLAPARKTGLGRYLTWLLYRWAYEQGFPYLMMRTAANGSPSEKLFIRDGAQHLPFVQTVSYGDDIGTQSNDRIWLCLRTEPFADTLMPHELDS